MSELFDSVLVSFKDELEKDAAPLLASVGKFLNRRGGGLGAGAGAGGMLGGLGGAAYGGIKGYREAREQGGSVSQSLGSGAMKALQGGAVGAVSGAALGGVGGAALMSPEQAAKLVQSKHLGVGSRFGQRQLHGLTGWTPSKALVEGKVVDVGKKRGLRSIRGGAYTADKELGNAITALEEAKKGKIEPNFLQKLRGVSEADIQAKAITSANKDVARARKGLKASEKAEEMGLTNLPGYVKALAGKATVKGQKVSPWEALKSGIGEQWHTSSPGGKAMVAGYPIYATGSELARESEPGEAGKIERAGRAAAESLAYTLGPLPLAAQLAAAPVMGAGGAALGRVAEGANPMTTSSVYKGIRRKTAGKKEDTKKPPPLGNVAAPPNLESEGQAVPMEHIYTPSALGQPPANVVA